MYDIDFYPSSLRGFTKKLSEKPTIHKSAEIINCKLGEWTEIGRNSRYFDSIVGSYTYDDGNVIVTYSEIGKFCSIASSVRINPVNHPKERVTQHHITYRRYQYNISEKDDIDFFQWRKSKSCFIGHDCWLGHNAVVMPGVKIGIGAIVGAHAVVTKDVMDYEVVVGVPARVIKKRFSDEIIKKLLKTEWWDWDRDTLEARFEDLNDINLFLEKYSK